MRVQERFRAVLLLLGAQDIGGAAVAGEQAFAVLGVEEAAERLDAAHDHQEIVLVRQGEDRVDEVVAGAFVAQIYFEAVGEEGEEVGGRLVDWPLICIMISTSNAALGIDAGDDSTLGARVS